MKWIFYLCILIAIAAILYHAIQSKLALNFFKKYTGKYPYSPITKRFDAATPRYYFPEQKYDEAVLLLHGFSSSPDDFKFICDRLEQKKIPHHAMLFTGYGTTSIQLLKEVTFTDWFRQALDAYDQLAKHAKKVHIVASSYGCVVGSTVAMYRPVDKFVAICPAYLIKFRSRRLISRFIATPVIGDIIKFVFPYYQKKPFLDRVDIVDILDPEMAKKFFHVPVVPANVIGTFYQAEEMLDLKKVRVKQFYLFTAARDEVVDTVAAREALAHVGIDYKEFHYENSAHGLMWDYRREDVANDVVGVLEESDGLNV
jgi:carboxylesterase